MSRHGDSNKTIMKLYASFLYMRTFRNRNVESDGLRFIDRLSNDKIIAKFAPSEHGWVCFVWYGETARTKKLASQLEPLLREQGHFVFVIG